MDGTLSGYYYHASKQGAKQTKWVLTLQVPRRRRSVMTLPPPPPPPAPPPKKAARSFLGKLSRDTQCSG